MGPLHVFRIAVVSALLFASVNGDCTNPRVRKEWRSLCADERASWIKAVNCLANLPHNPKIVPTVDPAVSLIPPLTTNSSYFDDFSYIHMDLNAVIHNTGFFLPWHRLFVQTFEDELKTKCGYDGVHPYWDWTQDAADFYHGTIFNNSTYEGLGTWGDPNNDYQIFDGGFKDIRVAYPVPHKIRRNFTNQPFLTGRDAPSSAPPLNSLTLMMNTTFTKEIVPYLVNGFIGDYVNFQQTLENLNGPHSGVHLIFGGDMGVTCPFGLGPPQCYPGPKWATNDPIFYLHHAMIDKVWYDWQHKNPRNKDAFEGGTISWQVNTTQSFEQYPTGAPPWLNTSSLIPSDGLWGDVRVCEVVDTVGGRLCYVYE